MTDHEALNLLIEHRQPPVTSFTVCGHYDGWLLGSIIKRDGTLRLIVEDGDGRLYIHGAGELRTPQSSIDAGSKADGP